VRAAVAAESLRNDLLATLGFKVTFLPAPTEELDLVITFLLAMAHLFA
jgi:hypothetical protein